MQSVLREKLIARAGKLLARKGYSRAALEERLRGLASPAEVASVLDRLEELALLDDAHYAYNFALQRLQRELWGPRRVIGDLIDRKVAPAVADAALTRVLDEVPEDDILDGYLQRHSSKRGWPKDRREIARLIAHLERRGFTRDLVYRSLRAKVDGLEWRRFEAGDRIADQ
jgi:regulatory protein